MNKKPLHIALLSAFFDPFMSGAEMCVQEIAQRLGKNNSFAITIITARLKRSLPKYEHRGRFIILRVGFGYRFDKWLYPFFAAMKIVRIRPDIVHAIMESYAGIALWLAGSLWKNSRRILTLQSGDLDEKARNGSIPFFVWNKIHQTPDVVTAISHFLCKRARACKAQRVELIRNGIAIGNLNYIREQSLEKKNNQIVCVARLSEEKGVHDLIDAFAIVHAHKPDICLHLIGDGNMRAFIEQKIAGYGLSDAVVVHGTLTHDDAMRIVAQSYISVLPSHAEGLGIAALEALGLGVPVVGSDVGGIPDIITHEQNGLLFRVQDSRQLAESIERLYDDQPLYEQCKKNTIVSVKDYDWKKIVFEYADLYRALTQPRVCIATGIFPPDSGGPATYVAALKQDGALRGAQTCVITYGETDACVKQDGSVFVSISRDRNVLIRYVKFFIALVKHLRAYDCVYVQDTFSAGIPARVAAFILRKPLIVKVVGDPAWERAQQRGITRDSLDDFQIKRYDIHTEFVRVLSRWVIAGADRVITPSEYLKKIVSGWGIDHKKIHVVYNAVSFPEKEQAIAEWPQGNVILYVGRLVAWKGLEHVITVLSVLVREISDAQVVIIGDGPEKQALLDKTQETGMQDHVHFLGAQSREHVMWAMKQARTLVLFSTYEGLAHVLIEAHYARLPIVASDVGGNSEVIDHRKSGLLVPPDDNMLLLKALRLMLTEEKICEQMVEAGAKSAERFNKKKMLDETWNILLLYARAHR